MSEREVVVDVEGLTPALCPFCQSSKVAPSTEKVDASTYWRCETCGEMWNTARLPTSNRNRYRTR